MGATEFEVRDAKKPKGIWVKVGGTQIWFSSADENPCGRIPSSIFRNHFSGVKKHLFPPSVWLWEGKKDWESLKISA